MWIVLQQLVSVNHIYIYSFQMYSGKLCYSQLVNAALSLFSVFSLFSVHI